MDPIKNPFSPGAGSPPPELVGRDPILEQARVLLGRIKQKRSEKSMLLTGLRGVGNSGVGIPIMESRVSQSDYITDRSRCDGHGDSAARQEFLPGPF